MYVILVDTRDNNGQIVGIQDDNGNLEQFYSMDEVKSLLHGHILCKNFPCLVVDLEDGNVEKF